MLAIQLFGPFAVCRDGQPLPRLRFRKSQQVLALLVLRHGAAVERDWLIGLLWPESTERQGLRNSLLDLRRALGPETGRLCSPTSRTLSLDLTGAAVDVLAFDRAIARGDPASLEEAIALYRGSLLEGCTAEWVFQERRVREQAYLQALERLAADAVARGEPAAAERLLRRAVGTDPLRESAQRALMQTLASGGNYAAMLTVYRELRKLLHQELNAQPDPETTTLFERLREKAVPGARCARTAAARPPRGERKPLPRTAHRARERSEQPAGAADAADRAREGGGLAPRAAAARRRAPGDAHRAGRHGKDPPGAAGCRGPAR
jgi:DNA-binding SARP family transcriptional activator